ncbi:MAG TPA: Crp/Fnr family transcriptional regulator [Chryseobacterium sp.]|nr:Crp/Fnr family transcriptional regulator [Chryseobacterium sp.]
MKSFQSVEPLISKLKNFAEISEDVQRDLAALLEEKNFKKNEIIISVGQVAEHVYFIVSGCIRFYHFNDRNEDITTFFIMENEFFSNSSSFLTGEPSSSNVAALEPLETFRIHKEDLYGLYVKHPKFEQIGRRIVESTFVDTFTKKPQISSSAEEKYMDLLKKNPELIRRIPVKYLAPYLGIHPNSLSRIRKNVRL